MKKLSFNAEWYFVYKTINGIAMSEPAQKVDLPHDATIGLACTPEGNRKKGFYPDVQLLYSKKLFADPQWEGKYVALQFDGVFRNARVYVNGNYVGGDRYGYNRFFVPIQSYLNYGEDNLITVDIGTGDESRWYSGAGIYRNVYVLIGEKVHFCESGIKIKTKAADAEEAILEVNLDIKNEDLLAHTVEAVIELQDEHGHAVTVGKRKISLQGQKITQAIFPLYIDNPLLWSPETPHMYTFTVRLMEEESLMDEEQIRTGIRKLTLSKNRGLCVNGKTVHLYGGCIHHDNGILGSAVFKEAEYRKIRGLKEAGYNAVRFSHNPMSEELMDACDKYGMLVMAELTDMWSQSKSFEDFGNTFIDDWKQSAKMLVDTVYNHPSVVMYSIGNELFEVCQLKGRSLCREITNVFHKMDDTRYITSAITSMAAIVSLPSAIPEDRGEFEINTAMADFMEQMGALQCTETALQETREFSEILDIVGYNYSEEKQLLDIERFPERICVGSETFPSSIAKNWKIVMEHPNVIGDFSWTAWDYIGEPGIGRNRGRNNETGDIYEIYPYKFANCGDRDITGFRRPQSYYRECIIGHRTDPYIVVRNPEIDLEQTIYTPWSWTESVSSWNWSGWEGKKVQLEVYGVGDEMELLINGRIVGRKAVPAETKGKILAGCTIFDTLYEPGYVEAILYREGKEMGRYRIVTASDKTEIRISEEKGEGFGDIRYFEVCLTDEKGVLKTDCDRKIRINVEGNGRLKGFGSALPTSTEIFTDGEYTTYCGRALLAVQPDGNGKITVSAECEGCQPVVKAF